MRSETVSTRAARRTARGTTRRKTRRSFTLISRGSRANETSCTVTTHGHGERSGRACCVWTRSAPRRRRARGSDHAMRSSCERAGSACGSIPSGTSSGCLVTATMRSPAAGASGASSRRRLSAYVSSPVRRRPRTSASNDDGLHVSVRHRSTTASARPSPREGAGALETRPRQLVAPRDRLRDACRERRDVGRVHEHGSPAGDLLERRAARGHDGRPARHRLEHGQAEAFVQRRVDEAARAPVERRELGVRHLADPALDVDPAPAARSDHAQVHAGCARGFDCAPQVLARLERGDREDVVGGHARAVGREDVVHPVRDHA